jgi:peptide/nickel transport system permease protein
MMLTTIVVCAIFGPALYPIDPFDMVWAPFSPPGQDGFLLGTDYLGRDLMAALIHGARVSIMIGFAAAFMSGLSG